MKLANQKHTNNNNKQKERKEKKKACKMRKGKGKNYRCSYFARKFLVCSNALVQKRSQVC